MLTYVLLKSYLTSRMDASLLDYADTTATSIAADLYKSSLPGSRQPIRFLTGEQGEWSRQIEVIDRYGSLVARSEAGHKIVPTFTQRVEGQKGHSTLETRTDLSEYPVRVACVPVRMGADVPYLVLTAASLEGLEDALRRASLILAVLTPSVFVISLLGGWVLVGRSLRPVDEITRTALAIEHTNLDRRIAPPATDDEIGRLASAFNEMISRLDRSFRQIQQFSADASHELKTPLTAMRGEAEVALMSDLTPAEYRRVLRSIVDEVERMSAIVENLLLLARADADQIQVQRERVELHTVALDVYEQLEGIARRKGVALNIGEMEEAKVEGDPLWLTQIVTNLLNNALKYTPAGGQVTLSLTTQDGGRETGGRIPESPLHPFTPSPAQSFARLTISDTGPGIPPEHLPHIFDRFYRVDSGRNRDAGGVGLGLNIARWAAEAHNGRIEVESEVGRGTAFTLCLPLAESPAVVPAEAVKG